MPKRLLFLVLCAFMTAAAANGHETPPAGADAALDLKLGQLIPADLVFVDEHGAKTSLRSLNDKPMIIAPVYLGCMHTCPLLLTGLAQVLGKLALVRPGRDFRVITFSIDEKDTPQTALDKKKNYLKAVGGPFPEEAWTFLTGDKENIKTFTDAVGFTFQRDGSSFSHPVGLVVVSPQGKIVRYLEGVTFLPFDITMAVTEAAEGRVGIATRKALAYCFSYDPHQKTYVFNILKITATVMILFVASFLAYLVLTSKKRQGMH